MAEFEPHERLADRVYGQLLALIFEQNLQPGARFPAEIELCRLTAASRPVVREALTRLQADGLIEPRRGAGSFVRQRPSEHHVQHLLSDHVRARIETFEVRIAIEPVAAALAARKHTEGQLRTIKAAAESLNEALGAGRPAGEFDRSFHRAIADASQNSMFRHTLDGLDARLAGLAAPRLALSGDDARERALTVQKEHETIVQAIEHAEAETAEAAMRLHLLRARTRAVAMR